MHASAPRILRAADGPVMGDPAGVRDRFMVDGDDAGGRFALVQHLSTPRALAAPLHRHHREDEYSYVVYASAGDLVHKPRDQWHTFWNAGDDPCRILEIIAPGGFERFFDELVEAGAAGPPEPEWLAALGARYGLEFDFASIPGLCERFGVTFG